MRKQMHSRKLKDAHFPAKFNQTTPETESSHVYKIQYLVKNFKI